MNNGHCSFQYNGQIFELKYLKIDNLEFIKVADHYDVKLKGNIIRTCKNVFDQPLQDYNKSTPLVINKYSIFKDDNISIKDMSERIYNI